MVDSLGATRRGPFGLTTHRANSCPGPAPCDTVSAMQLELVPRKDKGPDGKPEKVPDAGSGDSSAASVPSPPEPSRDASNPPQEGGEEGGQEGGQDGGSSRGPKVAQSPAPSSTRQGPNPFAAEVLARELNQAQTEAVVHPPGPLLVVAGAG